MNIQIIDNIASPEDAKQASIESLVSKEYKKTAKLKGAPKLTAQELRELLHYNPETGEFTWLKQRGRQPAGSLAGTRSEVLGYILIGVNGVIHYAQRLAWLYSYGKWPEHVIDHIDNNGFNNKLKNLQDITQGKNTVKSSISHNRGKLLPGVYTSKAVPGKFLAKINVHNKVVHLGTHESLAAAYEAYRAAKLKFHNIELPALKDTE